MITIAFLIISASIAAFIIAAGSALILSGRMSREEEDRA